MRRPFPVLLAVAGWVGWAAAEPPAAPRSAPPAALSEARPGMAVPPGIDGVRALLRDGRFPEAVDAARALALASPDDRRTAFYLGLSLHKAKRHGEALLLLERAAEAEPSAFPEAPHASHYLGWCRYYLGDLAGARSAFERHAAAFPEYDDTQFALGIIAYEEDRLPEAESRFRRALAALGSGPAPAQPRERAKNLARLGDVLLRQDRLADAEGCYREAVKLWPTHGEAWSKLARVLDRQGRAADAAAARAEQAKIRERTEREGASP